MWKNNVTNTKFNKVIVNRQKYTQGRIKLLQVLLPKSSLQAFLFNDTCVIHLILIWFCFYPSSITTSLTAQWKKTHLLKNSLADWKRHKTFAYHLIWALFWYDGLVASLLHINDFNLYKCSIYGLEASPRGCTLIVTGAQTVFSEVHLLLQCTFGLAQHWALSAAIVGSAVSLWPRPCMDTPCLIKLPLVCAHHFIRSTVGTTRRANFVIFNR